MAGEGAAQIVASQERGRACVRVCVWREGDP